MRPGELNRLVIDRVAGIGAVTLINQQHIAVEQDHGRFLE